MKNLATKARYICNSSDRRTKRRGSAASSDSDKNPSVHVLSMNTPGNFEVIHSDMKAAWNVAGKLIEGLAIEQMSQLELPCSDVKAEMRQPAGALDSSQSQQLLDAAQRLHGQLQFESAMAMARCALFRVMTESGTASKADRVSRAASREAGEASEGGQEADTEAWKLLLRALCVLASCMEHVAEWKRCSPDLLALLIGQCNACAVALVSKSESIMWLSVSQVFFSQC